MAETTYFNGYFGPPAYRKEWETQVATPVGQPCTDCHEPIHHGDIGTISTGLGVEHYECRMRAVVGSVAHSEGRCSCFVPGSTEGDPPGLTAREAAHAALRAYHLPLPPREPEDD